MAKRSVIEFPPSSSEEESSSVEKHRPKKRKLESTSHKPTKTVEESGEETEEYSSDEEETNENNEASKSASQSSSVESHSSGESKALNDNDRGKKSNNSKKNGKRNFFSMEDEDILLNSILKFRLEKGKKLSRGNSKAFCESLKGKLSFTPTLRQVINKIWRIKRKYSGSRTCRQTSEHDLKMKEVAGQIWNLDVEGEYPKRRSGYKLLEKEMGKRKISILKKNPEGDTVEKAVALEKKLSKQKKLEMKQELKRLDLMKETYKLILEGTEKSRNQV